MRGRNSTAALIALATLAACNDGPTTPAAPSQSPSSPRVAGAIRVEGPSSIAPGTSAQYRAIASFADGRTQDLTTEASWTSYSAGPAALLVGARGMVTGGSPGEADVIARYPATFSTPDDGEAIPPGTVSGQLRVLVLEPGTFRVSGRVTDSGGPLPTAQIAVVSGTGAGQTTRLRGGSYALYGLAGAVKLEVSEESFQTETRMVVVNDHATVDFSLQPLAGYVSVTGEWRLTLRAALSCGADIPEDAATRTFQASLRQVGSGLTFILSSPTIVRDGPNLPFGGVGPERLDFYVQKHSEDEDYTPPQHVLLEMLEPGRFLGIGGNARGLRTGNNIVIGTLSGEFSVYKATGPTYRAPGTTLERTCRRLTTSPIPTSETHSFRLERT